MRPLPPMLASFAAAFVVARWHRRRMGGAERVGQFRTALRSGRLPEDADPAVWRPLLEQEQRVVRLLWRWLAGLVVVVVALWALVAAVGTFTWSAALISTGLVLAVVVVVGAVLARQSARMAALSAQLPDHQPRDRHSAR
ncbi:hypothetical protein [Blastococcus sp. PRF04-17]|uniref:hypothetical protein n=1 Tax=Blastococcus sp. PRF04-17 TaxID=2933797 RepID=UPI001FF25238|nr:hypothetical protein [Blastococcus sp. PRF04-17]UOY02094.1 hypothetical protein MVA48_01525 [Blastococcus sp. PRF04-17]